MLRIFRVFFRGLDFRTFFRRFSYFLLADRIVIIVVVLRRFGEHKREHHPIFVDI